MIKASFKVIGSDGTEHSSFEMPFVSEKAMRAYLDSRSNDPFVLVQLVDYEEETDEQV